jgi:hypothetical protein
VRVPSLPELSCVLSYNLSDIIYVVTFISSDFFVLKLFLACGYRPLGQTLRPLIDSLSEGARGVAFGQNASNGLRGYEPHQSGRERAESPDFVELNTAIDEVRLVKVNSACC